jgi:hypothetical protein
VLTALRTGSAYRMAERRLAVVGVDVPILLRIRRGAAAERAGPNDAKIRQLGMKGYAAFLQNAEVGRGGTQSGALGWYTVSRWDTGRR